ncbi:hypothetical protein LTR85_011820 [Meristemomyces frigidus]|nr:hypothetical protein LTR85_011820 [Meristemomyces frigidus]
MSSEMDQFLQDFNQRAEPQLVDERYHVRNTYKRNNEKFRMADSPSCPVLTCVTLRALQPTGKGSIQRRVLYGALLAAAVALVRGLPAVYNTEEAKRLQAWIKLVNDVCATLITTGMLELTVAAVRRKLENSGPELLDMLRCLGTTVTSSAAVTGSSVALFGAIKAFCHYIQAGMAHMAGDRGAAKEQMWRARQEVNLDTACRAVAAATTSAALAAAITAGLLPATGVLSLPVPLAMFWVASTVAENILARKNKVGGWLTWFRTLFHEDQRRMIWAGDSFEEREDEITAELKCSITLQLVVDPVRHTRTGTLYERSAIHTWLVTNRSHIETDPVSGVRRMVPGQSDPIDQTGAEEKDYVRSDLTRALAREVAETLGAQLAVVPG